MNIIHKTAAYFAVILIAAGCAKNVHEGTNEASRRYLEAWMSVNYPGVTAKWNGQTDRDGIYIVDSLDGTGLEVKKDGYAIVSYTATDLDGNITSYTSEETARQLMAYSRSTYYGPQVWLMKDETIQAGLQNALVGRKTGAEIKVVIPLWLMTYSSYATTKEYLAKKSEYSNTIYTIKVEDFASDISQWELGRMKEFMDANYGGTDTFEEDTTGFYYKRLSQKTGKETEFKSDTTIYINYTGKLLNGLVFDTTIERVAKENGLYSPSKEYEPVSVTWGEKASDITMGAEGSSVVSGFALTLWNMRNLGVEGKMDKGVGVFYSNLGYGYSGSGASIPGYAPLVFEIEIVPEPED